MDHGARKRAVDLFDDDSHQQVKTTTLKMSRVTEKVEDFSAPSAAAAVPLAEDELGKLRKQLEEAQENWKEATEAVKRWTKEVEEAFQQFKKEEDPDRKASANEFLKTVSEFLENAKQERNLFSAQVEKAKAEFAFKVAGGSAGKELIDVFSVWNSSASLGHPAAGMEISDVPPSLEALMRLPFPPLTLLDDPVSNNLPIGPDGLVDMRFFPAKRPAADTIHETLRKLSEGQYFVKMFIAVSGAGKTSTIFQVARESFTIYIPCTPEAVYGQPTRGERDKSGTFADLERAVKASALPLSRDQEKTEEAKRLSVVFFVAHYFALYLFLSKFPSAQPILFLLFQLNEHGRIVIKTVFRELRHLSVTAGEKLTDEIREKLRPMLAVSRVRVLFAIDEMEGAAKLGNDYLSRNGETGRSLLSPFLQAASIVRSVSISSMLLCGTGSSQDRFDSITSDIGKGDIEKILADAFPLAAREDVIRMLSTLPGITRDMVESLPDLEYLIDARFRLVARSMEIYMESKSAEPLPDVRLQESIALAVKQHKDKLNKSIRAHVKGVSMEAKEVRLSLFHAVYVAANLSNGRMDFTTSDLDLCRVGLGALKDKDVFRVSERFAIEVIKEIFEENPKLDASVAFRQSVADLKTVLRARGGTTTAKGELFENVVFNTFRRACFQNKAVSDLPFVAALDDPVQEERKRQVWGSVTFRCLAVQALPKDDTDPRFVYNHPHVLLSPQEHHRADGIMSLPDGHLLQIGVKFYSSKVPAGKVESQFRATDPRKAYGHAKKDAPNQAHAGLRAEWDALGLAKRKALRIHVTIPNSAEPLDEALRAKHIYHPGTYLMDDDSLVVNINLSNLGLLFGNPETEEERATYLAITRLVQVVVKASEAKLWIATDREEE